MTTHRFTPEHASYLAKRKILEAAISTGVLSGTGLGGRGSVIRLDYGNGMFKYLNPFDKENKWFQEKPKNRGLPLWGGPGVDFDKLWCITEGELDRLAAIQSGFQNACSLPDGAVQPNEEKPTQSGKLRCIREAWDRIGRSSGEVILALDNDEPGEATRNALVDIFGRWRCREFEYPEHPKAQGLRGRCKDLNEVLYHFGPEYLRQALEKSKPMRLEGVFKISEITRGTPRKYYDCGIPGFDDHLKLFPGELCVMTGVTGHGKTTFLFNVLGNLVQNYGLQIGLGTFEADVWEDIQPWYETWLFGQETNKQTYEDTTAWLDENFTIISHEVEPLTRQANIEWFLEQATAAKGRHGIDVLVLDPWNKVQHKRRNGEDQSDYIGRALADIRNWAKVTNTVAIVTAHPTKEVYEKDGSINMPTEGHIHGSANWGNASDHVVVVYRPDKKLNATKAATQKSRFKKAGREGSKWYIFDEYTNRYSLMPAHMISQFENGL